MDLARTVIAKGKMFNYIFLYALKLLFTLYTFNSFNILLWLLTPITFYIMPLFLIIYISPILELSFLLWSLLKCLPLLESLVWPLLPRSVLIVLRVVS